MKPRAKASLLKRSTIGGQREARKYREEVDAEFKSERQGSNKLKVVWRRELRALTARRQFDEQRKTLEQKEQSISDEQKTDAREEQLEEAERQKKKLNLNVSVPFPKLSSRYYLGSDRENLTKGNC